MKINLNDLKTLLEDINKRRYTLTRKYKNFHVNHRGLSNYIVVYKSGEIDVKKSEEILREVLQKNLFPNLETKLHSFVTDLNDMISYRENLVFKIKEIPSETLHCLREVNDQYDIELTFDKIRDEFYIVNNEVIIVDKDEEREN